MKRVLLSLFMGLFSFSLFGQFATVDVAEHYPFPENRVFQPAAAVLLPNGNFLAGISKTDTVEFEQNMLFTEVDANGVAVRQVEHFATGGQYLLDIFVTVTGEVWSLSSQDDLGPDNIFDYRFDRLDENLEVAETFFIDRDFRDFPTLATLVGEESIAFLNEEADEILVVDLGQESLEHTISLPDTLAQSPFFLVAGGDGNLLLALGSNPGSYNLVGLNAESGSLEWTSDIPLGTCVFENFGLLFQPVLYDATIDKYLIVDQCLNVTEVDNEGNLTTLETENNDGAEDTEYGKLVVTDGGFKHFSNGGSIYTVDRLGDGYSLVGSENYQNNAFSRAHYSDISTDEKFLFLGYGNLGTPQLRVINAAPQGNVIFSTAMAEVRRSVGRTFLRSVADRDGEIIVEESVDSPTEPPVTQFLFYSENLTLLDSLPIDGRVSNVLPGSDNDWLCLRLQSNTPSGQVLELLRFSRSQGVISAVELLSGDVIPSNSFLNLRAAGNGGYFVQYYRWPDDFAGPRTVRLLHVTESGEELFERETDDLEYFGGRIPAGVADNSGNFYAFNPNLLGDSLRITKVDPAGNTVYSVGHFFPTATANYYTAPAINDAGTKLLLPNETFTEENTGKGEILEFDPNDGSFIRSVAVFEGTPGLRRLQAKYEPGNDNFVTLAFDSQPLGEVPANMSIWLRMNRFNTDGEVADFSRFVPGYFNVPNPYDFKFSNSGDFLIVGERNSDTNKALSSTLITLAYDELVDIQDVDQAAKEQLTLSPNPTVGDVRLEWSHPGGSYNLGLYDMSGRELRSWSGRLNAGGKVLTANVQNIPVGTFLLRLETEDGVVSRRIMKQ